MSTYINPLKPHVRNEYNDIPQVVGEYLQYAETIRGLSARTVNAYYIDMRTFLRFLFAFRNGMLNANDSSHINDLNEIDVSTLGVDFLKEITKSEIYEFLYYVTRERENAAATRARKLSSLKSCFKYLTSKAGYISSNPVEDVETPVTKKRLPKYLSLDESIELLNNIQSDFHKRDYCIITLLLNCGMRISELAAIRISDMKNDTLRIIGKGNKERVIYLNSACLSAIDNLKKELATLKGLKNKKALFVSKRTGQQLSIRRIQQIVDACLVSAGLGGKGYSAHKLRHTAATLMYQHGHVDMLVLKEILGHEAVSTTQIYTHLDSESIRKAAHSSPLANIKEATPKLTTKEKINNNDNKE